MQARLIIYTFLLITIRVVFCDGLNRFQNSITSECPSQEDIPKCHCKVAKGGLSITCKDFISDSELQSHLKSFLGYSLKKLEINNYNATDVPVDLYEGQNIQHLSFNRVEMDDASYTKSKRYLQGLENSLDTMEITKSFKMKPLFNLKLDHLKKLKHVIFEDNNIPEVGNDWFTSGPESLTTLIFENNGIEELGNEAFSSLNTLKLLVVAGNHINTISRSMLPKSATFLSSLDFASNKLRSLPKDMFSDMPALEDVNLDYNLIHMIPQDTWGSVASLIRSLSLEGNPLQCDEGMKWICDTKLRIARGKCSSPPKEKGLLLHKFCT